MNVVTPALKPQDYARANYLKRETQHAVNYANLTEAKRAMLVEYFTQALYALSPDVAVLHSLVEYGENAGTVFSLEIIDNEITQVFLP